MLASLASLSGAWHHARWRLFAADDLGFFAQRTAQPICVEAVALSNPKAVPAPPYDPLRGLPSGDSTRMELRIAAVRDGNRWRPASGRTTLMADGSLPGVHTGDRLRILGQLSRPRPADNPGQFDYAAYARADRKLSLLSADYPDCVQVIARGGWAGPRRWIEELRSAGDRLLWRHLDHRRSGLAAAVLLGAREEIDEDLSDAFLETGTIHILSISGLHVGMVALAAIWIMRLAMVPRRRAWLVVAAVTVLYTLLADAQPPAVRAAILVLVMSVAQCLGRQALGFNSLAAAALVVLVLNPADLFRTGVQLSFLCVAVLMWFTPAWFRSLKRTDALDRLIDEGRGKAARATRALGRSAAEMMAISGAVWLLTLPVVMARFHLLSPVALPLNALLWLPMMIALVSGFGVLAFGWLLPPLAAANGWLCDRSLWLLEWFTEWGRRVPAGHVWLPGPADWWLWGFYGLLAVLAVLPPLRVRRRLAASLMVGWLAVAFVAPIAPDRSRALRLAFLSVGHGTAVVIRLPSGQAMLYDAGQFGSPRRSLEAVSGYLWSQGITRLDAVILSHPDLDHYNAVPGLLERFSVRAVYVSPVMFAKENQAVALLERSIRDAGISIHPVAAGGRLYEGDGCSIDVLHPQRAATTASDNANSAVLAIRYHGRGVLLPGDLEPPGLDQVLAGQPWDCDLLLAPHHGSRASNPPGLADWCRPQWVIISGGLADATEETASAYRKAQGTLLHTGTCGTINVSFDSAAVGVEVRTFHRSPAPSAVAGSGNPPGE